MSPELQRTAGARARGRESGGNEPFSQRLQRLGLELNRAEAATLQVNVGLLCNQTCRHCHLDAGPHRREIMAPESVEQVAGYARRSAFKAIDITGGAPELNPYLLEIIERFCKLAPSVMLRSNLTALAEECHWPVAESCKKNGITIIASLPSLNPTQTDAQRGKDVMEKSISALRRLNSIGYGMPGSGLALVLVSNPAGAFLPVSQCQAEKKFRADLERKWGIRFDNLYVFANVPLGRFKRWLIDSGNYESYMRRLVSGFNPSTLQGLMCRTLVSVSWDGYLYDCDFNLAQGIPIGGTKTHVSETAGPPTPGSPVALSDHCYACTAGAGFT